MSEQPRKYDVVLRRRVRESQYIEIPEAEIPDTPSGSRDRSKRFILILLLIMIVGSALLATPLTTKSGERTPVIDAVFTSVSAVSVTGLVTVDTETHWNAAGKVILLFLIQIGGLGFMVGAGILFQLGRSGRTTIGQSLFMQDGSPSISLGEATALSRQIALFTFVVEGIGWAILSVAFSRHMAWDQAIWQGLFYSVSAFCNAGFDLQGNFESITGFRSSYAITVTIGLLVLAGALSFLVVRETIELFRSVRTRVRRPSLSLDAKLVLSGNIVVFLAGFTAMIVLEWNGMLRGMPTQDRLLGASFQAVAGRTSGFATVDWTTANPITQFVWLATMMVGGASGSTTGGVKIATVAVIFVAVLSTFRGDSDLSVFHRRISPSLLMRAVSIVAAFILIHFLGTIALAFTEYSLNETDAEFHRMLFDTMSALATVGLSTGIVPELTDVGKALLCILMFVGRLGPLTLGYALQKRSQPSRYRFPLGDVRIG